MHSIISIKLIVATLFCFFAFGAVSASEENPDILLQRLTTEIMERLELEAQERPDMLQEISTILVDEILSKHLDIQAMSYLVIGKKWKTTSEKNRQLFMAEFIKMLTRTHANTLVEMRGKSIRYKPFKRNQKGNNSVVHAEFTGDDGVHTTILFRVRENKDGKWLVFDIIADGVSLIKNYRSNFAKEINKYGVNGLIDTLTTHNI